MNEPETPIRVGSTALLGCCELHTEREKSEYNTCPLCLWHIHKAKCNECNDLKRQSSENCLEWQDWERWATEVLTDFKIPFDNHKVGMRMAMTQWMAEKLKQPND